MKKKLLIILLTSILILGLLVNIAAAKPSNKTHGKSKFAHLYLFEKDPVTWDIINGGAWGKMKYLKTGSEFDFNFNGHKLLPNSEYSLIYYPDPWPGSGLIVLGEGLSDLYGDLKIKGSVVISDLPLEHDYNSPSGAKIWLVLTSDVNSRMRCMSGWNPNYYLFENNLITFDSTWSGR